MNQKNSKSWISLSKDNAIKVLSRQCLCGPFSLGNNNHDFMISRDAR